MTFSASQKNHRKKADAAEEQKNLFFHEAVLSDWDYTECAYRKLGDVVYHEDFYHNGDTMLIYRQLSQNMRCIPFCEYLKRYLYVKAQLTNAPETISIDEYKFMIVNSFRENNTPASFQESKTKLSAAAQNWLTQKKVSRKTVFLLGFGLRMSEDDVNQFLNCALHEENIRENDEFEAICKYAYEHKLSFIQYRQLQAYYHDICNGCVSDTDIYMLSAIEKKEMKKLYGFLKGNQSTDSLAYRTFLSLYDEVRKLIADKENEVNEIDFQILRQRYPAENQNLIHSSKNIDVKYDHSIRLPKNIAWEQITPSDTERVFCAAIPMNLEGNPTAQCESGLKEQLSGTQMTRKHIDNLLKKKTDISRSDILMLCFFLFSYGSCKSADPEVRYHCFIEYVNENLKKCNMGGIYAANPFESFLIMCILSNEPFTTYSDILELSYAETADYNSE